MQRIVNPNSSEVPSVQFVATKPNNNPPIVPPVLPTDQCFDNALSMFIPRVATYFEQYRDKYYVEHVTVHEDGSFLVSLDSFDFNHILNFLEPYDKATRQAERLRKVLEAVFSDIQLMFHNAPIELEKLNKDNPRYVWSKPMLFATLAGLSARPILLSAELITGCEQWPSSTAYSNKRTNATFAVYYKVVSMLSGRDLRDINYSIFDASYDERTIHFLERFKSCSRIREHRGNKDMIPVPVIPAAFYEKVRQDCRLHAEEDIHFSDVVRVNVYQGIGYELLPCWEQYDDLTVDQHPVISKLSAIDTLMSMLIEMNLLYGIDDIVHMFERKPYPPAVVRCQRIGSFSKEESTK